ncbi:MAG: T9SS type A sorting domain-containing protein, partial [Bacteroidales bacterium]|nr:T9SS type A sorting domain-containing protein [Bacteroidales bacterium]
QIHLSQFTASPAVGITDNLASKAVNFYPNPATDFIYVETISKSKDNNTLEIMNLHGQIVKRAEIADLKQSVDISELKAGIYFVRAGNYTERLVIR